MQTQVIDRLVEHVADGRDIRIDGAAASARLAELAVRIEPSWNVVQVTAPQGGLSLSALIGQLSGRASPDDQDDAALEIGFRRLAGRDAPRTVLLLDAVQGLQLPVLRYLQHVGRNAPALALAVAAGADLDSALADPGLAPLRTRLATVIHTGDEPQPATPITLQLAPPQPVETLEPVALPADWRLDQPTARAVPRRRAVLWAASAVGMVASAALGAWLGHASAGFDRPAALETAADPPPAVANLPPALVASAAPPPSATVPPPPRITASLPDRIAPSPSPALAGRSPPDQLAAGRPPALLAALAPTLLPAAVDHPSPLPEAAIGRPPSVHEARRATPRVSRRHAWTRAPAAADDASMADEARSIPYYGTEGLPPERKSFSPRPAPVAAWRDPAPAYEPDPRMPPPYDAPSIGTFSTNPYLYRYDR